MMSPSSHRNTGSVSNDSSGLESVTSPSPALGQRPVACWALLRHFCASRHRCQHIIYRWHRANPHSSSPSWRPLSLRFLRPQLGFCLAYCLPRGCLRCTSLSWCHSYTYQHDCLLQSHSRHSCHPIVCRTTTIDRIVYRCSFTSFAFWCSSFTSRTSGSFSQRAASRESISSVLRLSHPSWSPHYFYHGASGAWSPYGFHMPYYAAMQPPFDPFGSMASPYHGQIVGASYPSVLMAPGYPSSFSRLLRLHRCHPYLWLQYLPHLYQLLHQQFPSHQVLLFLLLVLLSIHCFQMPTSAHPFVLLLVPLQSLLVPMS